MDLIAADSELRDRWAEPPGFDAWRATVADLRARLA
jgi:hypothetical protein